MQSTVAGILALLISLPAYGQSTTAAGPANTGNASTGQMARGEPYDLGGNRLVFTTWQLVRPGTFAWVDERGGNVSVVGNLGPREARFQRADAPHGIRLVAQPARRMGRIWKHEQIEGSNGIVICTLLKDGNTYKAWGVTSGKNGKHILYYESKDGLDWYRPDVHVTLAGSSGGELNLGEGGIFIDPSAPADQRYKCVTLSSMSYDEFERYQREEPDRWEPLAKREDVGRVFYVQGYTSADGLHWSALPSPLSVEHSDTQIVAYYDTQIRRYVIYTRTWSVQAKSPTTQTTGTAFYNIGRRSIGRTESDRFDRFPLSQIIATPSPEMLPSEVLYTNCRTSIPDAPFNHLMFPAVWNVADDQTSIEIDSSQDGRVWSTLPHGRVLQTAAFGEWDGGCIFARPNLVELPDGTFVLPYTGYNVPHKYPRGQFQFDTGYMAWPRGRIAAVEASELGEFSTIGFVAPGNKLLINADVVRAGSLRIEAADLQGVALPGHSFSDSDPLFGDLYRIPVTWKGKPGLGVPAGTPIILRFRIDRGKLFSLDFVGQ